VRIRVRCLAILPATAQKPNGGPARDVSLARAREFAAEERALLAQGINPKHEKKLAEARTFESAARELIASTETSWRNPGTAQNIA
jgi:hypothetical protein